jgi:hypothetical protein
MAEQKSTKNAKAPKSAAVPFSEMEQKLATALADWKEKLGEKKFEKRIKRAAKAFVKNLKVTPAKKATPLKKKIAPKKASKKATAE